MYSHSQSDSLSLDLIFDGTGVTNFGAANLIRGTDSVPDQIDNFLKLCFYMDGELHEPKFLKIQWGNGVLQDFDCRLKSVEIEYTAFERSGKPLRAKLSTVFVQDLDTKKRLRIEGKKSPDLSRSCTVQAGDTPRLSHKKSIDSSG